MPSTLNSKVKLALCSIRICRSEGLYNTIDELRLQQQPLAGQGGNPVPYSFRSSITSGSSQFSNPHEFTGQHAPSCGCATSAPGRHFRTYQMTQHTCLSLLCPPPLPPCSLDPLFSSPFTFFLLLVLPLPLSFPEEGGRERGEEKRRGGSRGEAAREKRRGRREREEKGIVGQHPLSFLTLLPLLPLLPSRVRVCTTKNFQTGMY